MTCSVASCCNTSKNTRHLTGEESVSFFRIPKDEQIRKIWTKLCNRKDPFNIDTARVCSEHFKAGDFTRDLKSELLNEKSRKILKPFAIPTINVFNEKVKTVKTKRKVKKLKMSELEEPPLEVTESTDYEKLWKEASERLSVYENTRLELMVARCQITRLENEVKELRTAEQATIDSKVRRALSKYLTPNQIQVLMNKSRRVNWTREELKMAANIRLLGNKDVYQYLRQRNFPLPSLSTTEKLGPKLDKIKKERDEDSNSAHENSSAFEEDVEDIFERNDYSFEVIVD